MEITISMDERDFEQLTTNSTDWAASWADSWEEQVDGGRFEGAPIALDDAPSAAWQMAYWMGDNWQAIMMARAFLAAQDYEYQILWDLAGPGEYVILTDYMGKTWADFEAMERKAEADTGITRGDLVEGDDFSGVAKVLNFSFARPQLQVVVKVPNAEPLVQQYAAGRVHVVASPGKTN